MNAKQLSKVAEVDMEMVRACLRVLKHHGVIALIDMFFYSNRYENTNKSELLSDRKIMDDAVSFVAKRRQDKESGVNYNSDSSPELGGMSPSADVLLGHFQSQNLASTFDSTGQVRRPLAASHHSSVAHSTGASVAREDFEFLRTAITEFYLSCNRNHSVGQMWVELVGNAGLQNSVDWKKAFRMLDHRRLITFGIVHGIIRRVHNYPMLVDSATEVALALEVQSLSLETPNTSPERPRAASPFHVSTQQLFQAEKRKKAIKAAKLLDGTHCDDELVCELEMPLEEILSLLHGKKIVSVFV